MGTAACTSADPALFFPDHATTRGEEQTKAAKDICGGCPVVGRLSA
ncbi:WhiB family transcriptional regulator [Streptomyces sp. NBC_01233]